MSGFLELAKIREKLARIEGNLEWILPTYLNYENHNKFVKSRSIEDNFLLSYKNNNLEIFNFILGFKRVRNIKKIENDEFGLKVFFS